MNDTQILARFPDKLHNFVFRDGFPIWTLIRAGGGFALQYTIAGFFFFFFFLTDR